VANLKQRFSERRAARQAQRDERRKRDATDSRKAARDVRHTEHVYDGTGERVDMPPSSQR
jgi:hypothetical protein